MAGWNLKNGVITDYEVSEDQIWSLFSFVFSDSSRKRNSYKFGLIKSLLDLAFSGTSTEQGVYYSYEQIFTRFTENYWNLVNKYDLRQMRKDDRSTLSKIETIIKSEVDKNNVLATLEFESINSSKRREIVTTVTRECKKCVIGALYEDFGGVLYSFDLKGDGLFLNKRVHLFIMKYKREIEQLNYYSWARFLEQVNDDDVLIRVIDKLELSTPRRNDLSVYRQILRNEFEENTCFYCGKKLNKSIHVDHFIPWSFMKDDKMWNFVLSCPSCNVKKSNKIPARIYLSRLLERNRKLCDLNNPIVEMDFVSFDEVLFLNVWEYAQKGGFKVFNG